MNYNNVFAFSRNGTKKIDKGLYAKMRKISLVVLGILLLAVFFSLVYKTKSIKLGQKKYYGVYLGSYAAENTANYYANLTKIRGGCGGIFEDESKYLVFAAIYINQADAASVASNLMDLDENAYVFVFDLPKITIKFEDGNKGLLTNIAALSTEHLDSLLKMAIEFDNHNANGSDIIVSVSQMISEVDSAVKELNKNKQDEVAQYLITVLNKQKIVLKQISSNIIKSADIKIAYFDLLLINLDMREHFE